jgi:hypothetical protein
MAANEYRQLSQNRLVVNHRLVFPVIQMISKSRAFFPCYKTQEKSIKVKRIDHQEMTSLTRLNVGIRLVFYIWNVFQTQWFNGRLLYTSGKNLEIKESSRHWVSSPTAKENLTNLWWFSWEQQDWLKICYLLYVWSFAIPDPNRTRINSLPLLYLSPFTFLIK